MPQGRFKARTSAGHPVFRLSDTSGPRSSFSHSSKPPHRDDRHRSRPADDESGPGVSTREVIHFVVRVLLVFAALIGVPTFVARVSHHGPMPDVTTWLRISDAKQNVRIYDTTAETTATVPMNTYILEVLSAEFSRGAPLASLEAGAVATRTYAIRAITLGKQTGSTASKHGADVTDDSTLDLPIATEADVDSEYPGQALPFITEMQTAIEATDGEIATYQKQPILAFMFEVSPGVTRSSEAVFGKQIPYLAATACPDDKRDGTAIAINTFTAQDIAQALSAPNVSVSHLHLTRSKDGFVQTVSDGQKTFTGQDFASSLHLPSTDFDWTIKSGQLVVTTNGRGTDIGMSLHEAQALATKGMTWQAIISHFYPGTSLVSDKTLISS